MADIDTIERLLCQRYNVQALDAGELSTALSLARGGDLRPLREALDARNLYRWREDIYGALDAETEAPAEEPEPETEPEPEVEPEVESENEVEPEADAEEAPAPRRRRR
jgi:hypothetical protein